MASLRTSFATAVAAAAAVAGCQNDIGLTDPVNVAPAVVISAPVDSATFVDDDTVEFVGIVSDGNGLSDIQTVLWVSSLDQELAIPAEAAPDADGYTRVAITLSAGTHTVTLRATDSSGLVGTDSISLFVDPSAQDPVVEIQTPQPFEEFYIGDDVDFTGVVSDPNQPPETLFYTWSLTPASGGTTLTLDQGNPSSNGAIAFQWPSAQLGNYRAQLEVIDEDSNSSSEDVLFFVVDPADFDLDQDDWTPQQGDCDDYDAAVNPGMPELCDNLVDDDCNGWVDDRDIDRDQHVDIDCDTNDSAKPSDDCDDGDPQIFPGAPELGDGKDNDCDGEVDEGNPTYDADGDCWCIGPQPCVDSAEPTCTAPQPGDCDDSDPAMNQDDADGDSWSSCDGDCDDGDATLNLDDVDGDGWSTCQGDCDDAEAILNLDDADADGWTTCEGDCDDSAFLLQLNDTDGDGFSTCDGDCNDNAAAVNPGVLVDDCDGVDNNCAGGVDEHAAFDTWYPDNDTDGWGVGVGDWRCDPPGDWVDVGGDCNDSNAALNLDDDDADGFTTCGGDCDDSESQRNPGFTVDGCDGLDNDCDGDVDEDALFATWFDDGDGDGWGDGAGTITCDPTTGQVTQAGDCDDLTPTVNPGQAEIPDDGIDQDCSGTDTVTCFVDLDFDGYGNDQGNTVLATDGQCQTGQQESTNSRDCNDGDPAIKPGVTDIPDDTIDQDCSGTDTVTCTLDADSDGFGTTAGTPVLARDGSCDAAQQESPTDDDCNDAVSTINPGAPDLADDGIDQDCSGDDTITCFEDLDRDGFGTVVGTLVLALDGSCDAADQESGDDTDCDDGDPAINPGETDAPNDGIDQDCSGAETVACYRDADFDGFGTDQGTVVLATDGSCDQGQQESPTNDDCNDGSQQINPAAFDIPDSGVDEDCSGTDTISCFVDDDEDGFGTIAGTIATAPDGSCDTADKESVNNTDCNDANAAINPVAVEIEGDTIDQNCDGFDTIRCFVDNDLDGVGSTLTLPAPDGDCSDPGESTLDTDCDDSAITVFPGAPETANDNIDQDCNGFDTILCTVDADHDGFGTDLGTPVLADDASCDPIEGESSNALDCNDADTSINPTATEVADDGTDQDCNLADLVTCILDDDYDTYGTVAGTVVMSPNGPCATGEKESSNALDCNDATNTVHPGATDIPDDTIDQDCNGADTVECVVDADRDGFGTNANTVVFASDGVCNTVQGEAASSGDCDDTNPTIYPNAPEVIGDTIDQDCNNADTILCFVDDDGDTFGTTAGTTVQAPDGRCDAGDKESAVDTDCDDANAAIHPGQLDLADDTIDQDCSGSDTMPCTIDGDYDGYGTDVGTTTLAADGSCDTGEQESGNELDCDDAVASINPAASDVPENTIDEDCNGYDTVLCTIDDDQDGYGTDTGTIVPAADGSCDTADRESLVSTDCDDADPYINPGEVEAPDDGIDQDCSGTDTATCIVDADFDGFGTTAGTQTLAADGSCDSAEGEATTSSDCDDTDADVNPSMGEVPDDGTDQDCSGTDAITCVRDADQDGFGTSSANVVVAADGSCDTTDFEAGDASDCNDSDAAIHPGATDLPDDGTDQDCSGADTITCFVDDDFDGYGTDLGTTRLALDGSCDTAHQESRNDDDCDDSTAAISPAVSEVPDDAIDQNCSGTDTITCTVDADHDGFGTIAGTDVLAADGSCDTIQGESSVATDCNDGAVGVNPSAAEIPDNGIDEDCTGKDTITCFVDSDRDGYGTVLGTTVLAPNGVCNTGAQASAVATDCNDADAAIHPGATEIPDDTIDQDCNNADTVTCIRDADFDGYGTVAGTLVFAPDGSCDTAHQEATSSDDCNDAVQAIHPGVFDIPDSGIDEDCSGADTITCYVDDDEDGYGNEAGVTTVAVDGSCTTADKQSTIKTDCDDGEATVHPGAVEVESDGIDQNCDGFDTIRCFVDADEDGFGSTATLASADGDCTDTGESAVSTDCNDSNASVFPGATEIPDDGTDQDCSGSDTKTCIVDADQDGYGTDQGTETLAADGSCDTAHGESILDTDCDDTTTGINPGAADVPDDAIDQDCSGTDTITCIVDNDYDTYGTVLGTTTLATDGSCDTADKEATSSDDCNDVDAAIHPNRTEVVGDGVDQDCNGTDTIACVRDADHDGFGTMAGTVVFAADGACNSVQGESASSDDCNDADPAIRPGAYDIPDSGIDEDCTGADTIACILDNDKDSFGTYLGTVVYAVDGVCNASQKESGNASDCNDNNAGVNPAAPDVPDDGIDQDCSGTDTKTCYADVDQDGYGTDLGTVVYAPDGVCNTSQQEATNTSDCNDNNSAIKPGVSDIPNQSFVDDNCDGLDGTVTLAVFVSKSGSDSGNCTLASPCLTLNYALGRADVQGLPHVYMQASTSDYVGVVLLDAADSNVSIYGGYDSSWDRGPRTTSGHTVTIRGGWYSSDGQYMTVRANSVSNVRFNEVVLEGPNASGTVSGRGRSSYTVHAVSSTGLIFDHVTFDQGDGAAGSTGADGSSATQTRATNGNNGANGDAYTCGCCTGTSSGGSAVENASCTTYSRSGTGGYGGSMDTSCSCFGACCGNCDARVGGYGGDAYYTSAGNYGDGGTRGSTCQGGFDGIDGRISNGSAGASGDDRGFLSGNFWYGDSGGTGGYGLTGGGGGGGGGSGGCDSGTDDRGAGGGSGGAGGCKGTPGSGGGAGGSSFGIFGYSSSFEVWSSTFYRGSGGDGGDGGTGGAGQPGGFGGSGGNGTNDSGPGGDGGDGGHGGHGGGGGGGAAGSSYGIYRYGGSHVSSGNSYSGGAAGSRGLGGASATSWADGNTGSAGHTGVVGTSTVCTSTSGC